VFTIVLAFLILTPFAFGANLLDTFFNNPAIKGLNIAQTYQNNYPFIDAILYFVLFIGVASTALGERFKNSKTVPTMIGVMLAIGMAVFEYNSKPPFNLGMLAPFAALVFFLIFGMAVYSYTKSFSQDKILPIALAAVTMITLINWLAPDLKEWINKSPFLSLIVNIVLIVAFIALMIKIFNFARGARDTHVSTPSSSENSDISSTFPSIQPFKKKAEDAENIMENFTKDDKSETDIIKEEKQLQNASNYISLVNAEGKKFTEQLDNLKKKESDGAQREAGMLNAINQYTNGINTILSQITDASMLDEPRKIYIENYIKGIIAVCAQIVENQKAFDQACRQTAGNIADDIGKIDDAIGKIQHIENGLKIVKKNILKDIGDEVFEKINAEIKRQGEELKKDEKKLSSENLPKGEVREALNEAASKLGTIKLTNEEILKQAKPMREAINGYFKGLDVAITDTKVKLKNIKPAGDKIKVDYSAIAKSLEEHKKAIEKMIDASKKLKSDLESSAKHSKSNIEQIPIDATTGVAKVFTGLIETKESTGRLYTNGILPMIGDVRMLELNTRELNKPISAIQESILKVQTAYTDLIQFYARGILGDDADIQKKLLGMRKINTTKKVEELVKYVEEIVKHEDSLREQMSVQTIESLNRSEASIKEEISKIQGEVEQIIIKQKFVLGKLTASLNLILKHKLRVNESFQQEADKYKQQMAQATQKVNEPRSNPV
jgi:DNA repair exonuclease SbcCD ATPase subunit